MDVAKIESVKRLDPRDLESDCRVEAYSIYNDQYGEAIALKNGAHLVTNFGCVWDIENCHPIRRRWV